VPQRPQATATVLRLRKTRTVQSVVIDPHSPGATLITPLTDAEVTVTPPSTSDLAVAHGTFLDELAAGRLRHAGQAELDAAVGHGTQRSLGGATAWQRRGIPVDVSPRAAATLAVWGCSTGQLSTTCSNRCTEETHERSDRARAAGDGIHRGTRRRSERTPSSSRIAGAARAHTHALLGIFHRILMGTMIAPTRLRRFVIRASRTPKYLLYRAALPVLDRKYRSSNYARAR
jgi:hypothetical protein